MCSDYTTRFTYAIAVVICNRPGVGQVYLFLYFSFSTISVCILRVLASEFRKKKVNVVAQLTRRHHTTPTHMAHMFAH